VQFHGGESLRNVPAVRVAWGSRIKSFAGKPAPTGRRRGGHLLTGEKKGLAKQDLS
jgi:hypothetical protein